MLYNPIAPSQAAKVQEWCRLNYDETTGIAGYPANYYKTVNLKSLDPLGNIAEEWELGGAWPREVDFGELDWASSEAQTITLTLRYNTAKIITLLTALKPS